jgi:hypothetical protein
MDLDRGFVSLLMALLLSVSCAPSQRQSAEPANLGTPPVAASPTSTAPSNIVRLASNTQATLGNVRIGAGNFRDDDYVDGLGESKNGPTAGLWLFIQDRPAEDRHLRVGTGSSFTAGRLSFEVLEVTNDTVYLRYSPPP